VACEDIVEGLEAIVLAGDVSNKPKVRWKYAFQRLRDRFGDIPIHVFPGNHDFYDWRLDDEDRLADFAAEFDVSYAQMQSIILGETRLLCATLWTDYDVADAWAYADRNQKNHSNDFRYIRVARGGYRPMRIDDVRMAHRRHLQWLEAELEKPWDGRTVMVTHHVPHPTLLAPVSGDLNDPRRLPTDIEMHAKYASDLSHLFEGSAAPDMAIYGHSHSAFDGSIGRTQFRCVSLGYPSEIKTDDEIRARIKRAIFEVGPAPSPRP